MAAEEFDRKFFVLPNDTPFSGLDCSKAFDGLTEKERLYAYYLSQASWYGGLIIYHQASPESPLIFLLLHKLFKHQKLDELKRVASENAGFTEDDFKAMLVYAAGIFSNSGNYKGYGDCKFVPNLEKSKFESLIHQSRAYEIEKENIDFLLTNHVLEKMFSLDERERRLDFSDHGVTAYHSRNVTKKDTEKVDSYMKAKNFEAWNTRLFKNIDAKTGKTLYEIRLASIEQGEFSPPEEFEDFLVKITKGDYGPLLERVNHFLALAKELAANSNQVGMLEKYIEHFKTGSLDSHKDGSRFWIKDVGPAVESYIGFIENYRDPAGSRAEFEGIVAMVNRVTSEKFARLVDKADEFLALLPWDRSYERDRFIRPDFTSLDVLTYASSHCFSGINIPNYDEIRTNEGFKNVYLSNVIAANPKMTKMTFLNDEDKNLTQKYDDDAFEVQVGIHELLGHGSGKLFIRNKDGTFNFDIDKVKDLESGQKITSWYDEGEIYSTKFGAMSSAYEECRAEAVGYYLCTFPEVMKMFGHTEEKLVGDIKYVNLLQRFREGLVGLEHYSSERNAWGQVRSRRRISPNRGDREREGRETGFAIHVGSIENRKRRQAGDWKLFEEVTDNQVSLIEYPETPEGAVQSYIERYSDPKIEGDMLELWKKDQSYFSE